jgi:photosystem II stability/assembly factor-like uncharacterized protein
MRLHRLVIFPLFSIIPISIMAQWEWQNPLPQGQSLHSIEFINENEGWAAGEDATILHTTDRGETWEYQNVGGGTILYDMGFIDDHNGIAVGGYPYCERKIIKTTNGGKDWTEVLASGTNPLYDLFILDQDTCMVVGAYGELLISVNGGNSWQGYYTGFEDHFRSCWFFNSGHGWIVGEAGTVLMQNADHEWIKIDTLTSMDLYCIYFMDENNGLICGEQGTVFRTQDGGSTWNLIEGLPNKLFHHIDFCSPDKGWITGKQVLYTIDAGKTWEVQGASGESASHPTCETGYTAGFNGNIFRTLDAGTMWTEISSGYHGRITDICFIDELNGWAFENGTVNGLLCTHNGGLNWERIDTTNYYFTSIFFVDAQHGWAVGFDDILYTSDGGYDWELQLHCNSELSLEDIFFTDPDHGWVMMQSDTVFRTTNGGITWEAIGLPSFGFLEGFFLDQNLGWIVGYNSNILKTTDGGITWTDISPAERSAWYNSVCFTDSDKGWVVGDNNLILHTRDGGETWEYQSDSYPRSLYSVTFVDSLNGWISASYGEIFYTADGGLNWQEQESYCWEYLFKICFTDQDNGWAAGLFGTIIHTSNGGFVGTKELPSLSTNSSAFNYPNPFQRNTSIEYELVTGELVSINIFDQLGRKIETLLCEKQQPGKHTISWDASDFSPGIYFYSISTSNKISIGKMLVVR